MAEYLILIYGEEAAFSNPPPGAMDQMMKGHQVFGERNAAALRGGNALQPTGTATSLRPDSSGGFVVTDGAFAETKEALGGYYLVEATDQDIRLSDTHRPGNASVEAAVADAHRREWAFVLAATVRVTGDIDLAEECVQDAYARALTTWGTGGIPEKPGAWLTTVARRRAIDLARRDSVRQRTLPLLVEPVVAEPGAVDVAEIIDDRLRLMFTCCHPAIASEAQVALTLRLLCGLTTAEVARAFLVSESTMAARLTRAKKKIAMARIPFRVPPVAELPRRI